MKKARSWLEKQGVEYHFHDFRKHGLDSDTLQTFAKALGWEVLLNRNGMTWRKLPGQDKADLNENKALALMLEHPAVIKRPVLLLDLGRNKSFYIGFREDDYKNLFLIQD